MRNQVIQGTARRQVPWEHSALTAQSYFAPPKAALEQQMELAFWNTVKDSENPAVVKTYLERYPDGAFAALARALIGGLEKEELARRAARDEEQKRIQAEQKRLEEARKAADLKRAGGADQRQAVRQHRGAAAGSRRAAQSQRGHGGS